MNNISKLQNDEKYLDCLASQRQIYSDAKVVSLAKVALNIPVPLTLSVVAICFSSFKVYSAFLGTVIVLASNTWLRSWEESLKEKAAKIQERFDCDVLGIDWHEPKVGKSPDPEDVVMNSLRYKKRFSYETLLNWYPMVDGIKIEFARLICQRSNCRWDSNIRRQSALILKFIGYGLIFLIIPIGFFLKMGLVEFHLSLIAPLTPLAIFAFDTARQLDKSADKLDRLKVHSYDLWNQALNRKKTDLELAQESRFLQDELFDHRRNSPLIPDLIYHFFRNKNEIEMQKTAQLMINEVPILVKSN